MESEKHALHARLEDEPKVTMGTPHVAYCTSCLLDLESRQVADKPRKIGERLGRSLIVL